jgi:glutaminyl-tRNA synthetase
MEDNTNRTPINFIEQIIEEDIRNNKNEGKIVTRFPPEPNGYLHIGHAKSICLNFGIADKYNGVCNLRFDDTNPAKEEEEYVNSIIEDVEWLGFHWDKTELYTSNYFHKLYDFARTLIEKNLAYVDDLSSKEIADKKGTPTLRGEESPFRNRPVEESLRLFQEMKEGKIEEGEKVVRAKIDMASPNMHMRDPVIYRIKKASHHRTGSEWNIYPMYDFAHGQSDAIEGITHSLCTLEFEVHRPLYNWFIENLEIFPSRQIEFARLNLTYTVLSKRRLLELVEGGNVTGWDDPRMPTISGLRRRGYTANSIKVFADKIGVAKRDNVVDVALLEFTLRDDLNKTASRVMGIQDPVKLIITNYDKEVELLKIENNPEDETAGCREIPFSNEVYIEASDFMEDPPNKFFRLGPGREVRLKAAYIVKCEDYVKDPATGKVTEIHCTYDPATKSGSDTTGKKVKGTLSWVSAKHAIDAEIRLYDRLFVRENMTNLEEGDDFKNYINPDSLQIVKGAKLEPSVADAKSGDRFQFLRKGYFCVDKESTPDNLVFNRTVTLRDTWAKKR